MARVQLHDLVAGRVPVFVTSTIAPTVPVRDTRSFGAFVRRLAYVKVV